MFIGYYYFSSNLLFWIYYWACLGSVLLEPGEIMIHSWESITCGQRMTIDTSIFHFFIGTSRYFSGKMACSDSESKIFRFDFHDTGARIVISGGFIVSNFGFDLFPDLCILLGGVIVNVISPKCNLRVKRKHFCQPNTKNDFYY